MIPKKTRARSNDFDESVIDSLKLPDDGRDGVESPDAGGHMAGWV
jgi:hypothetical protein